MALGRDMSRLTLLSIFFNLFYNFHKIEITFLFVRFYTGKIVAVLTEGKEAFLNFRFKEGI